MAMTRVQRIALGAVGGLIVLAFVAWAVVAAAGGAGGRDEIERLTAGGSTGRAGTDGGDDGPGDAAGTTGTTFALVPVTGGAPLPTTTAKPPPKPPPPPPESFAAAETASPSSSGSASGTGKAPASPPLPPAIGADGAFLVKPDGADADRTRTVDKAKGCYSAVDAGWRIVDCGALKRADVTLLWLTEQHPKTKGLRVLVLRERTAGQWAVVLHARDDDGKRFSSIGVRGADVSGDGQPDLVFGFHRRTPDKAVGVDVVDGPGVVTLHRDLPGPSTSVHANAGQLDTWASQTDGTALHQTIKVIAGAWRVASSEPVPRSSVPPSMV